MRRAHSQIQRLTKHLERIELEISDIRRELKALPKRQKQDMLADTGIPYAFANKAAMREQVRQLLISRSVQELPVGAETVQKRMREAELTVNELSQSIIAAREELFHGLGLF